MANYGAGHFSARKEAKRQKREDWELALLDNDEQLFASVTLLADGFNISFQKQFINKKCCWVWYLDGEWKGIYSDADNAIGQKFGLPKRNKMKKDLYDLIRLTKSKYLADKQKKEWEAKIVYYSYSYSNAHQIIKRLKETCEVVELVERV